MSGQHSERTVGNKDKIVGNEKQQVPRTLHPRIDPKCQMRSRFVIKPFRYLRYNLGEDLTDVPLENNNDV